MNVPILSADEPGKFHSPVARPESHSKGVWLWGARGILVLAALLPYLHSVAYPFVWDDAVFILNNEAVKESASYVDLFVDPDTLSSKQDYNRKIYRPVRSALFALLYRLFGDNSVPFHLLNLLLHVGCTLLVFSVARTLLSRFKVAFLAALIFAVHPAHAEAVTWISSLGDVLSAFLFLLALRLYLVPSRWSIGASIGVVFPLALLSKEMAVTLPLVLSALLLWSWFQESRRPTPRQVAPVLASFGVAAIYLGWRFFVLGTVGQTPITVAGVAAAFERLPFVHYDYLQMLLFPINLCPLRGAVIPGDHSILHHTIAIGSMVAMLGAIWIALRRRHLAALLGALFWVTLLPVMGFVPVVIHVAERFVYLPAVFFILMISTGLAGLSSAMRRPWLLGAAAVLIALLLAVRLAQVNLIWRNRQSITLAQVNCVPVNPNAYWNLGTEAVRQKDWQRAQTAFTRLLSYDPNHPKTLNSISYVHLQLHQWEWAAAAARKSLSVRPDNKRGLNNLGAALIGQGQAARAEPIFRKLTRDWPDDFLAQLNLSIALQHQGKEAEAKAALDKALHLNPTDPIARRLQMQWDKKSKNDSSKSIESETATTPLLPHRSI